MTSNYRAIALSSLLWKSFDTIIIEKAFDRIEYVKLFSDLRERKLCPIIICLLMNMYVNQCLQVKWPSLVSERFSISNGGKQGGIYIPFYSVYT